MIQLKTNDYYKAVSQLDNMKINNLFAKAVVYQHMPGTIYVDNENSLSSFYILHSYGMSLLFGSAENEDFNRELCDYMTNKGGFRKRQEWLQVYPDTWKGVLRTILGTDLFEIKPGDERALNADGTYKADDAYKVIEYTRVNFEFDENKYVNFPRDISSTDYKITRTTKDMFEKIHGSVIPRYFWWDENHFAKDGVAYSLIYDGEIAATAFSAFRIENQLEIGIETMEKYRRKGLAFKVCIALIDFCLENGLKPVWSCRKENVGSYKLACKLGFVPTLSVPYYQLRV